MNSDRLNHIACVLSAVCIPFCIVVLVCCNSPSNTEAHDHACHTDTIFVYTGIPLGCSMYCPDIRPELPK